MCKYFLTFGRAEEREVTQEEFIKAERQCGFRPKYGDGVATGGFGSGMIHGRVEYPKLKVK
jgi:hypothetical protein